MDILVDRNYKSLLDNGIKNPIHIISIGPANDVEYYTTEQQQIWNEDIESYIKMSLKDTLRDIFV